MICHNMWGKHLRLGNFLYVYYSLLCICKRTGQQLVLPDWYMWKYLRYPPQIDEGVIPDETFPFRTNTWSREEQDWLYQYFTDNKDRVININLGGNNQSELWFQDELEYIKEMSRFKPDVIAGICKKYAHILGNGKKTIGVGVRRGDFVGHGVFYQIPVDWYTRALEAEFPDWRDCNILFFSDHIEECKQLFHGDNFYFAEPNNTHTHADNFKYYHNDPMEQFILGTLVQGFIGGNSTFTWWQMWYVHNNGYKVVHSGKNLSEAGEQEFGRNPDFYPKNWTLHEIT